MIYIILLSIKLLGALTKDTCCTGKTVGGVDYRLKKEGSTFGYGCLNDCMYERVDDPGPLFCFKEGDLKVVCEDGVFGTTFGPTLKTTISEGLPFCPDGWSIFQGKCFQLFTMPETWNTVLSSIAAIPNAYLVEIESEVEQEFVFGLAKNQSIWLGGSDKKTEGVFRWESSDKIFYNISNNINNMAYHNFLPGQPNARTADEDCLKMTSSGKWDDQNCDGTSAFMIMLTTKIKESPTPVNESSCKSAVVDPSPILHTYAVSGLEVDNLAFSSCYIPERMPEKSQFWTKVGKDKPDLWLWLGDNVYNDGYDMDFKRKRYNLAREEQNYIKDGPVKNGSEIPIMATWDDHDCCTNDDGNNFPCFNQSQQEFSIHFNIPKDHPINNGQEGIYDSQMFVKPGTSEPGIHVIMMDTRTGRDPTYSTFGNCKGSETKMMSETQWNWLNDQLAIVSEVKVIGSGIQVLPPTNKDRAQTSYCADDSHSGGGSTFLDSQEAVGENGTSWQGSIYESWAEIPQERAKLLGLAQRAINLGKAKVVVFVSGDVHFGELQAKKMPQSVSFGNEQTLYEVTASGVYQNWIEDMKNSNRLRGKSCDRKGSGPPFNEACVFPFNYEGVNYNSCVPSSNWTYGWCSTKTDSTKKHQTDFWGNCSPPDLEIAQLTYSNSSKTCSQSNFHICSAEANFGFIHVSFENKTVKMGVNTPEEEEEMNHLINY